MLKGIANGVPKDIFRIPMWKDGIEYEGWEVRDNQDTIIWGANKTMSGGAKIDFKGYGLPLKSCTIKGNEIQNGTPSPDNIIMPTFCGVRTGNLFDGAYKKAILSATGSLAIYNTGSSGRVAIIPCNPSTQYTVKKHGDSNRFIIAESETSPSNGDTVSIIINNAGISKYTFTAAANTHYILVYVSTSSEQAEPPLMLNTGSTALPYEPYGWKIPLTCAGQTTPVYLGQTQTVRRIKKLVLDGTESWQKNDTSPNNYLYYLSGLTDKAQTDCICTHFPQSATTYPASNQISAKARTTIIYIYLAKVILDTMPSGNTKEGFKEYLAAQYANGTPVIVWYVLAEPETTIVDEPLAKIGDYADELSSTDAAITIPTVKGQNTLTVDTTLPPSKLTITGHIKPLRHKTITGQSPLVFTSNGLPLTDWSITGQTKRSSKNLFNKDNTTVYNAWIRADRQWIISGQDDCRSIKIPCSPNTEYTLSVPYQLGVFRISTSTNANLVPGTLSTPTGYLEREVIRGTNLSYYTFTTSSTEVAIVFQGSMDYAYDWFNELMFCEGSEPLTYEPYEEKCGELGNNILPRPAANSVGTFTSGGITFEVKETGEISISGTATSDASCVVYLSKLFMIPLAANQSGNGTFAMNNTVATESGKITVAVGYNNYTYDTWNLTPENRVSTNYQAMKTKTINHYFIRVSSGYTVPDNFKFALAFSNNGVAVSPFEPYQINIPITCGGETQNIYLPDYLGSNETIDMTDTGISVPTIDGENTFTVGTTLSPSEVSITGVIDSV